MQSAVAQDIPLPASYAQEHPRLSVNKSDKERINAAIRSGGGEEAFTRMKAGIDAYVTRHQTDSAWILSRLQMYWKTKATEVYIKGGVYDHAEGEAPVPTVKFPGTRDNVTVYAAPKLEDMQPYVDDPRGVYLVNRSKPGQPLEWTDISKTGRVIENINTGIMGMAHNAALIYFISGEEKYARFAFDLFDTYMTGMYYRTTPKDLTHGHHETIAGLSTFEVIQESSLLGHLIGIYDYLYDYCKAKTPGKTDLFATVLRRWADVQINHGVAFNNWDLIEARNIINIASVLEDDKQYSDGKGRQYYLNFVLNKNAERQWSVRKLLQGYDPATGLWNECPGYSLNVLRDFTELVALFDRQFNHDVLPGMSVLEKAVPASAQYLFPNGFFTSFGDTYYGRLSTGAAWPLVANAQQHGKAMQETALTRYIKTIDAFNRRTGGPQADERNAGGGRREGIAALLQPGEAVRLKETIEPVSIETYVTPVFSAPM
ncbi:hypothetical protein [Paraflavitalea speifideaquila]|uniref:hypothetical protein n=1 Tax=Paraflavitalea speifideaquila TaxID=3076558 RepID=UPI0028E658B2|nr:hypothetical protein [Paraflavitalea speifideiaquila]